MNQQVYTRNVSGSALATNKVLRNTYFLLSLTLIFSAFTSWLAIIENAGPVNIFISLAVIIGFPFLLQTMRNSPLALVLTFAYTGFIGWMIGPLLNFYIENFSNGSELILMALGGTGTIFLVLSAISLNPARDYSHWARFLMIGMLVAFVASLLNVFLFKLPMMQLAISVVFSFISGGYIMYQTNLIVRGGENNYITATVVLYVSLVNIFLTLLQILGMFGGNRNN